MGHASLRIYELLLLRYGRLPAANRGC